MPEAALRDTRPATKAHLQAVSQRHEALARRARVGVLQVGIGEPEMVNPGSSGWLRSVTPKEIMSVESDSLSLPGSCA